MVPSNEVDVGEATLNHSELGAYEGSGAEVADSLDEKGFADIADLPRKKLLKVLSGMYKYQWHGNGVVDAPGTLQRAFGVSLDVLSKFKAVVAKKSVSEFVSRGFVDRKRGKVFREFHVEVATQFAFLGEVWGTVLSLWVQGVPAYVRNIVVNYLNGEHWNTDAELMKVLKWLGEASKKYADYVRWERAGDWQFLVDLQLFGGYQANADEDAMFEDVKEWTVDPVTHNALTGDYNSRFKEVLNGWFKLPVSAPKKMTFREFLQDRWLWARAGSSTTKVGEGLSNTKYNLAWTMSDERLIDLILKIESVGDIKLKLIEKLELGKVRGVISVDDSLYLTMSYMAYFVEDRVGNTKMFNFMSSDKQFEALRALTTRQVMVPLDESGFDHNKDASTMMACLDATSREAQAGAVGQAVTDIQGCADFVRRNLYGGTIDIGSRRVKVEKGLLSGWRLTYFWGTMINITQVYLALAELKQLGMPMQPDFVCSGDDVGMCFDTVQQAATFITAYRSYGYVVNPAKFWVSNTRNEFLRQTFTRMGARGYANRMLPKVCFTNPLAAGKLTRSEKVRSIPSVWSKLYVRGLPRDFCIDMATRDVSGALGCGYSKAYRWLMTPTAYGGGGCGRGHGLGYSLELVDHENGVERKASRLVVKSMPGVRALASYIRTIVGEDSEIVSSAVTRTAYETLTKKNEVKLKDSMILVSVVVPPPAEYGPFTGKVQPLAIVRPELIPIANDLLGGLLDGEDVPSSTYSAEALRDFENRTRNWSESAKRAWLLNKTPSCVQLFSGRDTVRAAQASATFWYNVRSMRRVTLETMRSYAWSMAFSSAGWTTPSTIWFE